MKNTRQHNLIATSACALLLAVSPLAVAEDAETPSTKVTDTVNPDIGLWTIPAVNKRWNTPPERGVWEIPAASKPWGKPKPTPHWTIPRSATELLPEAPDEASE